MCGYDSKLKTNSISLPPKNSKSIKDDDQESFNQHCTQHTFSDFCTKTSNSPLSSLLWFTTHENLQFQLLGICLFQAKKKWDPIFDSSIQLHQFVFIHHNITLLFLFHTFFSCGHRHLWISCGREPEMILAARHGFFVMAIFSLLVSSAVADGARSIQVTYDARSLIIDGNRELLFSGSIHYPRSTPEVIHQTLLCNFWMLGSEILMNIWSDVFALNWVSDVAWAYRKGQAWRFKFDTNLCVLEHSWACEGPGIVTMVPAKKIIFNATFIFVENNKLVDCGSRFFFAVRFWRTMWRSEILQDDWRAGHVCNSQAWTIHPSWMEPWV